MAESAYFLLYAPLVLAALCVGAGIALWRRPREESARETASAEERRQISPEQVRNFFAGCLLFVAFGIGACYAYFFLFF
jgi:hypothetical protein